MLQAVESESRPSLVPPPPAPVDEPMDREAAGRPSGSTPRRIARWLDLGLYLEAERELGALDAEGETPTVTYYRCLTKLRGRRPGQLPAMEVEGLRETVRTLVEGATRAGVEEVWLRPAVVLWAWIEDELARRGAAEGGPGAEQLLAFAGRPRAGVDDREELERLLLRMPATAQGGRVGLYLRRALRSRS